MATQDSNTPFAYATMAGFFQRGSDTSMSDECHRFVQNLLDTTCGRHGIVETLSKVKAYTDKAAGNTTDKNDSAESVGSTAAQGPPWMWESQESRMAYKAVDSLSQYILLCSDVHQFIIDPEFEITDRYVLHHQVATLAHVQTARAEGRIPPELDDASVIQLYQAIAGVPGASFDIGSLVKYLPDPSLIQHRTIGGEVYDSSKLACLIEQRLTEPDSDPETRKKEALPRLLQEALTDFTPVTGHIGLWDLDFATGDANTSEVTQQGALALPEAVREIDNFLKKHQDRWSPSGSSSPLTS